MNKTHSIFLLDGETCPHDCGAVTVSLDMPELPSVKIGFSQGEGNLSELVWMARDLLDLMANRRISEISARGLTMACHKGCHAACCHYLISVSVPEALKIVEEVIALPEEDRVNIVASCRKTAQYIQEQMAKHSNAASMSRDNLLEWYKGLNIACPMLKDNCCRIYEYRPIVCRECLAVGSSDQCRQDNQEQTHIRLPIHPANILMRLTQQLFRGDSNIISLPGVFDWFTEKGHLYQKTFPRELLVERFVSIAMGK